MPFVLRDAAGTISAVSHEQHPGYEWLAPGDSELRRYLATSIAAEDQLSASDLDMVRVVEDLIELLVAKGTILFTELPDSAQEKMLSRQKLRHDISGHLDLLGDD